MRIVRPNESEMGAVDGEEPLDDGFGDLARPEVPAETPVAGREEDDEEAAPEKDHETTRPTCAHDCRKTRTRIDTHTF